MICHVRVALVGLNDLKMGLYHHFVGLVFFTKCENYIFRGGYACAQTVNTQTARKPPTSPTRLAVYTLTPTQIHQISSLPLIKKFS